MVRDELRFCLNKDDRSREGDRRVERNREEERSEDKPREGRRLNDRVREDELSEDKRREGRRVKIRCCERLEREEREDLFRMSPERCDRLGVLRETLFRLEFKRGVRMDREGEDRRCTDALLLERDRDRLGRRMLEPLLLDGRCTLDERRRGEIRKRRDEEDERALLCERLSRLRTAERDRLREEEDRLEIEGLRLAVERRLRLMRDRLDRCFTLERVEGRLIFERREGRLTRGRCERRLTDERRERRLSREPANNI